MKTKLFALLIGLPFLALGQSELSTNSDNAKHVIKKAGLAKQLTEDKTKSADQNIATTLISDVKKKKPQLDFNLKKPYHLSMNANTSTMFNGINGSKKGPILLNEKPLDSNGLFDNN